MMRSLWIAGTGLAAQQTSIEVISNNLANVSTVGFKKSIPEFQDLLYQTFRVAGSPTTQGVLPVGVQLGLGVHAVAVHRVQGQGNHEETKNALDVMIEGEGFFQVTLPDGTTAYTRDGSFKLNNEGVVVTEDGMPILPSITIPTDTPIISISPEGVVAVAPGNSVPPTVIGNIELVRFINPAGLNSLGKNLYQVTGASGEAVAGLPNQEGFGGLRQGFIETSNVNIAEEMVKMIVAQRAYELNAKAIQTSDEMLSLLYTLKR